MRALLLAAAIVLLAAAPAAAAPELVKLGDFRSPVHVASPPGDQRVFVVEQDGRVQIVGGGTLLDISADTLGGGERGLLSMAFAPDYATSGLYYVFLTSRPNGDIEVREYRGTTLVRTLIDEPHSASNHNGGQLQIGPDGALYASIGDNADPGTATDAGSPFGKIHRIDLGTGASQVWSSGLRNPWRFSFDRATGDLLIGDVGGGAYEEINWSRAPNAGQGVNYGWPCNEGANGADSCGTRAAFWHANGPFCAIVGGYVVRDAAVPSLNGRYLYGDNCNANLWSAALGAGGGTETGLRVSSLSSFGEDSYGRIYAASLGGPVYRIQETAAAAADATAPRVRVRVHGVKRKRYVRVALRCDEACRVTVRSRLRGIRRLKARHRSLAAGRQAVVRAKMSRKVARRMRRALKRRGYVRFVVSVRAVDATGNARVVTRRGRMKR